MTALAPRKHITEAQAVEAVKSTPYGGLEQLALHIYSLPPEDRRIALEGTPEKAAHLLDIPVTVLVAVRQSSTYNVLVRRYTLSDLYSPQVQSELDEILIEKIRLPKTTIPESVKGRKFLNEGLGITEAPAVAGGSITVNVQQNTYYGGTDVVTSRGTSTQESVQAAEEAVFRPLSSGGLPPEGVRELPSETTDLPLFLHREDRDV